MTKVDFLEKLEQKLQGMPEEEIMKTIDYYSEMIEDAIENGENESDFIGKLGNLDDIAKKAIKSVPITKVIRSNIKNKKISGGSLAILIAVSPLLLIFAIASIAVIIGLCVGVFAIVLSGFALFLALLISGIVLTVSSVMLFKATMWTALFVLGTGLLLTGLSISAFYIALIITKLLIRTIKFIKNKVSGRGVTNEG